MSDPEQNRWFAEQVQPHERALRAWLCATFPTLPDVDDLVQESYARMLRAREREKIGNAKSYLFSTARNAALDIFRRHRLAPRESLHDGHLCVLDDDRPDAAETLTSADEFEILRRAIESLPKRCRDIMTLQKLRGLSNAEIADRLGISVNTVNAQMVIGLVRCRNYLRARGVLRGRRNST